MPASFQRAALILAAFALGGAVSLQAMANEPPLPPPGPPEPVAPAPPAQQAASQAASEGAAVAPLGQAMLHAKVAAIETGPGYECRTQDRIAGAKISAHAKGLAVDFVAIGMADKRRVLVERQISAEEASYLRAVRSAACGWFTTVLGPGSDAFHANNMHLDVARHDPSGNYRICE